MSQTRLKVLALVSMFYDHFIRFFPLNDVIGPLVDWLYNIGLTGVSLWVGEWLPYLLLFLGRIAAPVFMFCIVQGFLHTRNIAKYITRVLATAVLAQLPYILFNLAEDRMNGIVGDWREVPLNILFTLGLGLLVLWGYATCMEKGKGVWGVVLVLLACGLARFVHVEGSEGYILIIFAFYLTRNRPSWQKALLFIAVLPIARYRLLLYTLEDSRMLLNAILNIAGPYLGILLTCLYSGEKGKAGKGLQRFMYAFYPLHLIILALIGFLIAPDS
jgi:hypothetical protein